MALPSRPALTQIDLFAGAGGLSFGFGDVGFSPIYATDFDKDSCKSFELNHPQARVECADILTVNPEELRNELKISRGELDVLVGGPPCQGFSTYGKRDANDARNSLYKNYLSFLSTFLPKTFVIENVVGILSMNNGEVVKDIIQTTEKLGYTVDVQVLNAVSFGVPQFRKRVFFIGNRLNKPIRFPEPTHGDTSELSLFNNLSPKLTVSDAISDLPEKVYAPREMKKTMQYAEEAANDYQRYMRRDAEETISHSAKRMMAIRRLRLSLLKQGDYGNEIREKVKAGELSPDYISAFLDNSNGDVFHGCRSQDKERELELRKLLSQGHHTVEEVLSLINAGGFANKYRRLKLDAPSHTLVAHMARDCSDFVHPEFDRFISVREAARLQSFPDWYALSGSQFSQLKQIGNAVPPLLSLAIAKSVREAFD
jgi:DNA (cytosine-5)-methyltransferase 1